MLTPAAPASDVTVLPQKQHYVIGDVINCTAIGFPEPTIQWYRVNSSSEIDVVDDAFLTIDEHMMGPNVWRCEAANEHNSQPAEIVISFTVSGLLTVILILKNNRH